MPSCFQLFIGFAQTGLSGFGGVLPHARRMLVERQGWLNDQQFTELLGIGQGLPGPNVVNVAILTGQRFHGWQGAVCAVSGLMLPPLIIVLSLAELYARFAHLSPVQHALSAVAAAGSGLILTTGGKLALKLERKVWSAGILLATFMAVFWLHLPLLGVLAIMLPISLLCAWRDEDTPP